MPQVAFTIDPACNADLRKCAFWAVALDIQAQERAKAWGFTYRPVNFYSTDVLDKLTGDDLAKFIADSWMMSVQTALDVPGALGYHDFQGGFVFSRSMYQGDDTPITLSHEDGEQNGDPGCDQYRDMGNGKEQALELSDRVEGDSYPQTAVIGSDSMDVKLSNYLLPAAFVPGSAGPWDRLNKLTTWDGMTSGGYMIVRDANGNETQVFAKSDAGRINLARKLEKPRGRLARRLRGRWAP
jgi:hypothetical protein